MTKQEWLKAARKAVQFRSISFRPVHSSEDVAQYDQQAAALWKEFEDRCRALNDSDRVFVEYLKSRLGGNSHGG